MCKRDTDDMKTALKNTVSIHQFLKENEENFHTRDVSGLVEKMIKDRNLSKAEVAKAAGMSEVYLHQLISGRRKPSRTRLLCICIGLKLSLEETQNLMQHAGMAMLYSKSRRDAIIIYGISHELNLFEINDLLFDADEDTLS